MFYHDIKAHCSPSALDNWVNNRSAFIRSYFKGEKSPETSAMKTGKKVHMLIEAGLIPSKCAYDTNEEKIEVYIGADKQYKFLGIPDSRTKGATKGVAKFVDYKTGKDNEWKLKLPSDLKMKATAWLVWKSTAEPKTVIGHIEYIATEWDPVAKEIVPIENRETQIIEIIYSAESLQEFEGVIVKCMNEINVEYEKWLQSTDETVSKDDMILYSELKEKKTVLEEEIKEVGERLLAQMEIGGTRNVPFPTGTFYIVEKKTYEYPSTLKVEYNNMGLVLEDVEEIEAATKAAKKNFEVTTEPKAITQSLGFRATKEK